MTMLAGINNVDETLKSAGTLLSELVNRRPERLTSSSQCPATGGVYLIYEGEKVIYVGKAKNLARRIFTDHLSEEVADTMSAFRRSLNRRDRTAFGPGMRTWIVNNCLLAYLEISDADLRGVVESMAIAVLRTPGLLNKN
jgi:hypothetical protein